MCGIAGLIHKGKQSNVGSQMTSMLQALKHRGPDSTGYAVYSEGKDDEFVMRVKVAEADDMSSGRGIYAEIERRVSKIDEILQENGVEVKDKIKATEYALRYVIKFEGDMGRLANHIEEVKGAEILSIGKDDNASIDLPKEALLSIVVNTAYQGRGHAENLFNALCSHFREEGASSFSIVVGSNLDRAHAFYKKMGSIPVKEIQVHKGTSSVVYLKELG